jgi:hypothetical protein
MQGKGVMETFWLLGRVGDRIEFEDDGIGQQQQQQHQVDLVDPNKFESTSEGVYSLYKKSVA